MAGNGFCLQGCFRPYVEPVAPSEIPDVPVNVPVNVPINVPVNERQAWLLEQLSGGNDVKVAEIVKQWGVVPMTAKRDIANLKGRGIIEFVGAPKTGRYRLKG
jgi:ATP-dependent DNA helicase RecG